MKISIITVCYNSASTISETIQSVLMQKYSNIEYIVIDGGSSDNTQKIVESYGEDISIFVSEPDKGIYDAMNKGIKLCSGDFIGILNSDDYYESDQVIENLVKAISPGTDIIFGDVTVVDRLEITKKIRFISATSFAPWKLKFGWMPPHPATFVHSSIYEKLGIYRLDYKIAADYEFFVRVLLANNVRYTYNPNIKVTMREGGASTKNLESTFVISQEILRACKENRIQTNAFFVWGRLPWKLLLKIHYFFSRKFHHWVNLLNSP